MKNKIVWHGNAWDDYLYWLEIDKKMLKKINELIKVINREPLTGIEKLEPLLHSLKGYWSRRIDREHRLVYSVSEYMLTILSCRNYY